MLFFYHHTRSTDIRVHRAGSQLKKSECQTKAGNQECFEKVENIKNYPWAMLNNFCFHVYGNNMVQRIAHDSSDLDQLIFILLFFFTIRTWCSDVVKDNIFCYPVRQSVGRRPLHDVAVMFERLRLGPGRELLFQRTVGLPDVLHLFLKFLIWKYLIAFLNMKTQD